MCRTKTWIGFLVGAAVLVMPCLAHGPAPTDWPLERIVANLEARLRESPNDGFTHYCLGRAHGFAFALERSSLLLYEQQRGLWIDDLEEQTPGSSRTSSSDLPPPSPAELLDHLTEGVRHLLRACELASADEPSSRRFELTTAWLLETGAHLASRVDTPGLFQVAFDFTEADIETLSRGMATLKPGREQELAREWLHSPLLDKAACFFGRRAISSNAEEQARIDAFLRRYWLEQAIEHYRRAFEYVAKENDDHRERYVIGLEIAQEASTSYCRLVRERGFRDQEEERYVAGVEQRSQELERLPQTFAATPVLLSLDGCRSLDELVTPSLSVPFDLDGDAVDELWPWLAPDAGWLVWDPHHSGEITSGQQLFGSASGWLFFEDWYRVLDALDDDRNGKLEGAELDGVAVWFDRDSDGVSDRGEVIPVAELGIVALSTHSTLTLGASPANLCGVELADGRVLPTYDWVLAPVTE